MSALSEIRARWMRSFFQAMALLFAAILLGGIGGHFLEHPEPWKRGGGLFLIGVALILASGLRGLRLIILRDWKEEDRLLLQEDGEADPTGTPPY